MELTKENLYHWRIEQCLTVKEIGELSGHCEQTVRKHLRRYGMNRPRVELKMIDHFSKMKVGESISRKELLKVVDYKNQSRFNEFENNIIREIHSIGIYRDPKNNYVKVV
ncbi:hypothetical protein [Bacillus paralicheniformis]|uniref:hypothetical protein n=1 Tax=Bacillus paralicheniformis TaxID=1648923 RepID=UPI00189F025E|nr:hypothetical protein [Bacillus paralicheniformis]